MRTVCANNNRRPIDSLPLFTLALWILAIFPAVLPADNTSGAPHFKRFQVELFGGYTNLNPKDLNLFVDYDTKVQEFSYDFYLDYLQASGQIRSWTKSQEDERKKIRSAFPLGIRLKYYFTDRIAVSAGFQYFSSRREAGIEIRYTRSEFTDEQYEESTRYSPYSLSTRAYAFMMGIHLSKKINKAMTLEGFVSGGPLFAECRYLSRWSYDWWIRGSGYNWLAFSGSGVREEEGNGTGIALELGARLEYPLISRLEIFLEGGYSYQLVNTLSGSGNEVRGDDSKTWDGRLRIKEDLIAAPWGTLQVESPTSFHEDLSDVERARDFNLNLSGFILRLGLSFRF